MEKMQESINKGLKELKNKHTETNSTITEIKNTLEGINSRISETEQIRDFWDHTKCTNIQIIGVPEEEEKNKGYEKIFEELMVENFPDMEKEIVNQIQEAQRVPYRINPRRNMQGHTNQANKD